jgi:CRP-like cAMP-binding protein
MSDGLPPANGLLAALPREEWERMRAGFESAPLVHRTALLHVGSPYTRIHFPLAGVVSTVAAFESGATAEMATIGREGMVEIGAILGSRTALSRHMVQVPGESLSIGFAAFLRLQEESPAFRDILLRYAQAYLVQVLQSAACNAVHSVQERAARWLLTCQDRNTATSFPLTQEFLAQMLGVSRPIVSTIARTFQQTGLIRYARGTITIVDRARLEQASCECYRLIRKAYAERSIGASEPARR